MYFKSDSNIILFKISSTEVYIYICIECYFLLFLCVCVHKFVCARVHVSRGQKSILHSLELELQAVVSTLKYLLRLKFDSWKN